MNIACKLWGHTRWGAKEITNPALTTEEFRMLDALRRGLAEGGERPPRYLSTLTHRWWEIRCGRCHELGATLREGQAFLPTKPRFRRAVEAITCTVFGHDDEVWDDVSMREVVTSCKTCQHEFTRRPERWLSATR